MNNFGLEPKRKKHKSFEPKDVRAPDSVKGSEDFKRALWMANHKRGMAHYGTEKFEAKGDMVEKCKAIIGYIEDEESSVLRRPSSAISDTNPRLRKGTRAHHAR